MQILYIPLGEMTHKSLLEGKVLGKQEFLFGWMHKILLKSELVRKFNVKLKTKNNQ